MNFFFEAIIFEYTKDEFSQILATPFTLGKRDLNWKPLAAFSTELNAISWLAVQYVLDPSAVKVKPKLLEYFSEDFVECVESLHYILEKIRNKSFLIL